jgi:hypothetical protein
VRHHAVDGVVNGAQHEGVAPGFGFAQLDDLQIKIKTKENVKHRSQLRRYTHCVYNSSGSENYVSVRTSNCADTMKTSSTQRPEGGKPSHTTQIRTHLPVPVLVVDLPQIPRQLGHHLVAALEHLFLDSALLEAELAGAVELAEVQDIGQHFA